MLINTHEIIRYRNKQYIVFVDSDTEQEEFVESESPENEFNYY